MERMFEGIEKLESENWTRRKKVVINCVKWLSKGGLNRFLVQSGMSCEFVIWYIAWGRKGKKLASSHSATCHIA